MYVDNAVRRQQFIAVRERILAGDKRIRRIPHELQIGMIDGVQDLRGLGRGRDVAGMLVFETDDQTLARRLLGQPA